METPVRIYFVGNNLQSGKLRARFLGKNLPTAIQIKGTTDSQPVKLKRNFKGDVIGKWVSRDKYTSRAQTLQLIQCGKVISEVKYTTCGDLIVDNPNATLRPGSSITADQGTVTFKWTSDIELGVFEFSSQRSPKGANTWDEFESDDPIGDGSSYQSADMPVTSGDYDYQLVASFTNGSNKVLMSQTLSVVVPTANSAQIQNFAGVYDENTGNVDLSWTVTQESSVTQYVINRLDPGASTYQLALTAVNGLGDDNYPNFVANPGDYSYQILPVFVGGVNGAVLATITVTVPVLV